MEVRLDKYLWAVRLFKTRSDAAEAIRNNRVLVDGAYSKPSREVRIGDTILIKRPIASFSYRVLDLVSSRQGAKLVANYIEDITSESERAKLNIPRETIFVVRDRGAGRPTKRDRRQIDDLMEELSLSSEDE